MSKGNFKNNSQSDFGGVGPHANTHTVHSMWPTGHSVRVNRKQSLPTGNEIL